VAHVRTLAIANRGEIARRIMRTAHEMGLRTAALYGEPDAGSPYVREADVAVCLGGVTPAETFLDIEAVVSASVRAGADAVHPGYGFLAENHAFAAACAAAGLTFVGPRPETIRVMGDKLEAKRVMEAAGVPTLPRVELDPARPQVGSLGMPVMIKAAAGGGGRGMRLVRTPGDLTEAVASASREAASAFGDGRVFAEAWLAAPRHVEVQVVGDASGNVVHLGERECSIQRRHQKIIEEAPAPGISQELREQLWAAAVAGAKAIGYVGAGTFEFLVDGEELFFLEVNTRLQVEHPVTEAVWGVDLVRMQLEVAEGRPLRVAQAELAPSGHAVEARICAEDPRAGWAPSAGTVHRWRPGPTPGVRFDSGVEDGSSVSPWFDSLLAKAIAHAPTRREAAARLARALGELAVHGPTTNRGALVAVLSSSEFLEGQTATSFLDEHPELVTATPPAQTRRRPMLAAALHSAAGRRAAAPVLGFAPSGWRNVWSQPQQVTYRLEGGDESRVAYRIGRDGEVTADVDGEELRVRCRVDGEDAWLSDAGTAMSWRLTVHQVGRAVWVNGEGAQTALEEVALFPESISAGVTGTTVAPLPGTVISVEVSEGDEVRAGQTLVVLEAMKMEHRITAPADGVVAEVRVKAGQSVDAHEVVVVVREAGAS